MGNIANLQVWVLLGSIQLDFSGLPSYGVKEASKCPTRRHNKSGKVIHLYKIEPRDGVLATTVTAVGQYAAILSNGLPEALETAQASHHCHNQPKGCFNPRHPLLGEGQRNQIPTMVVLTFRAPPAHIHPQCFITDVKDCIPRLSALIAEMGKRAGG